MTILSPIRIVFCFILLSVIACFAVLNLDIELQPKLASSELTITCTSSLESPEMVEQKITSVIEGACSKLSQLKKTTSVSSNSSSSVTLLFDAHSEMKFKLLELSEVLREIYPQLPSGTVYPVISSSMGGNKKEELPVLTYVIYAPEPTYIIRQKSIDIFGGVLTDSKGISAFDFSVADNMQVVLRFDENKIISLGLKPAGLIAAIRNYFKISYPGSIITKGGNQYFIKLSLPEATVKSIGNIVLPVSSSRSVHLNDIATLNFESAAPKSFFRINGQNAISLTIFTQAGKNKIAVSNNIKRLIREASSQLPTSYGVMLSKDETQAIGNEISNNFRRAGLSLFVLTFFVSVIYKSWKYVVNLLAGLFANICLIIFLSWTFRINIHIYTIEGLTVAFGLMLDNAIVMLDHYHRHRNRKIFLALLTSTLIAIATLSLIFFLPEKQKANLMDFAIIIILSLVSSLIVSLLFTPSLYETLYAQSYRGAVQVEDESLPEENRFLFWYTPLIGFISRFRRVFVLLLILSFGIPFFMLPSKINRRLPFKDSYNKYFGDDAFQESIRPELDRWLGGTLYLFARNVFVKNEYGGDGRTTLRIEAKLPFGSTLNQMNDVLLNLEHSLSGINGIERYVTRIENSRSGSIEIKFTKLFETSSLPFKLKTFLVSKVTTIGGVEWSITGHGQGFVSDDNTEIPSYRLRMKGYNYDELTRQAKIFSARLTTRNRVGNVNINEAPNFEEKQNNELFLALNRSAMSHYNIQENEISGTLSSLVQPFRFTNKIAIGNQYYDLIIKEQKSEVLSDYDLMNSGLPIDSGRYLRLGAFSKIDLKPVANYIFKENREYIRFIGFQYTGSAEYGTKYLNQMIEKENSLLPIGFRITKISNKKDLPDNTQKYLFILCLLLFVFFACSILFENLRYSLLVIISAPLSFIGIFLIFYLGSFYFDEGGYASFLIVSGLVVNASIFILNDVNNLKRSNRNETDNALFLKALANRFRTILVTIISTICGVLPFVVNGQGEAFWFSLGIGTIGGLSFALLVIFLIMPVMKWQNAKRGNYPVYSIKNPADK